MRWRGKLPNESNESPPIIFFGTPEFAVESLRTILREGFRVQAVVTAPDKPAGRGLNLSASPVKRFALSESLPVLQPARLNDPGFIQQIISFDPALFVIVAFRILPREVWGIPRLGAFNLHASLLPQYRGAAPIPWAIINGETETGITTFFINDQVDTGEILMQEKASIAPDETGGDLHNRLMKAGAELVVRTIRLISSGKADPLSQVNAGMPTAILKTAPKLKKQDLWINWDADTLCIYNRIRGLSPHPGAFATISLTTGATLKVQILSVVTEPFSQYPVLPPGSIVTDRKKLLKVASRNGFIHILSLRPAGSKTMSAADFLNGHGRLLP